MKAIIDTSAGIGGEISAIPSKSEAHRCLICAALSGIETKIYCGSVSDDIEATAGCLAGLGANISYDDGIYTVVPISEMPENAVIDCRESGSTLRFLLPVIGALGIGAEIKMHGRLPKRPLSPLWEELERHGMSLTRENGKIICSGKLSSGEYSIAGNVSSQFISGLLFALSVIDGESTLNITGKAESVGYINITLAALKKFGADISFDGKKFVIKGNKRLSGCGEIKIGGDWSNAAVWFCGAAASGRKLAMSGLDTASKQRDRDVLEILSLLGCDIFEDRERVICIGKRMSGLTINAENIPDIIPVICAAACAAKGKTVIKNAQRLRLKESDRLKAIYKTLRRLGADVKLSLDGVIIKRGKKLSGGVVDSFNDHRVVMMAVVAAVLCRKKVTITRAEAINKSYPGFWDDLKALGGSVKIIPE